MWTYCDSDIETKFCIDNGFFRVVSVLPDCMKSVDTILYAYFLCNDQSRELMIGRYTNLNGKNIVDKKYSVSYLDSTGIDCNSLSHFIIKSGNNKKIEISPFENSCSNELEDLSVKRAKEVLENIKNKGCLYDVNLIIDNINAKLQHYAAIQMPFMKEYLWHIIENKAEDFGLSAVRHIISSDGFCKDNSTWYFGFLPEKRLCALAVKKESETDNPFTNVSDCTVVYSDTKINEHFFVAGILLLDDGQYFCRLS